jgi:hypothetical protein
MYSVSQLPIQVAYTHNNTNSPITTGQWFSPGTTVSSTNKINHHDIAEILLKVALNTINQNRSGKLRTIVVLFKERNLLFVAF